MARILFALDLGGGYGHLTRILPVADRLATRGHEIVLALRPGRARTPMLARRRYRVVDAPAWTGSAANMPPAECYADVLLRTGYAEPGLLPRLLRGWRALYEQERPGLVIGDFAPTAALAAQLTGQRHALLGSGYTLPPRSRPMPRLRRWVEVPASRIALAEARALGIINEAMTGLGGQPLAALEQSLAADASFLCCFPEFDHFGARPEADYYGNFYETRAGAMPDWPGRADAPRALAYLRAGAPNFLPMVRALAASGLQTVLHARDLTPALRAMLPAHGVTVSAQPLRLDAALAACAMVVCHSPNTAAAALVAGRPVLLLPEHVEQEMAAERLASQGLAYLLPGAADTGQCAEALRAMMEQPRFQAAAQHFALRYHGYDPADAADAITEHCEDLLTATF